MKSPHKIQLSLLTILFFTAVFSDLFGQSYIPFLDDSKVWHVVSWNYDGHSGTSSVFERSIDSSKDTIINGIYLRKFKHKPYYYSEDIPNRIVYHYDELLQDTQVLYDFNLKIGDTIDWVMEYDYLYNDSSGVNHGYSSLFVVIERDSIEIDGNMRRIIRLGYVHNPDWTLCDIEWVEGIGSNLSPLGWERGRCYWGGTHIECQRDHRNFQPIYGRYCTAVSSGIVSQKEFIEIFPNPSNGLFSVQTEKQIISLRILSSTGSLILNRKVGLDFSTELDISSFTDGLYTLEIQFENEIVRKKIIKG